MSQSRGEEELDDSKEGDDEEGPENEEQRMQALKDALQKLPMCLSQLKNIYMARTGATRSPSPRICGVGHQTRSGGMPSAQAGGPEIEDTARDEEPGQENCEPDDAAHIARISDAGLGGGIASRSSISAQPSAGRYSSGTLLFHR